MKKYNGMQKIILFTLFIGFSTGLIVSSVININFDKVKETSVLEMKNEIEKKKIYKKY